MQAAYLQHVLAWNMQHAVDEAVAHCACPGRRTTRLRERHMSLLAVSPISTSDEPADSADEVVAIICELANAAPAAACLVSMRVAPHDEHHLERHISDQPAVSAATRRRVSPHLCCEAVRLLR